MTLPTPEALAARAARGAYLLDFVEDMPDVESTEDVLAPFRVILAETVAHADQGDTERAEAAQVLYQAAEALKTREAVSRKTAAAATKQAQRMARAAGEVQAQLHALLERLEQEGGDPCVVTPIGDLYLRATGRPKLVSVPDDPSAWPIEWTRPGKPKLDRKTAGAECARLLELGEELPEGFKVEINPRHPMLGR